MLFSYMLKIGSKLVWNNIETDLNMHSSCTPTQRESKRKKKKTLSDRVAKKEDEVGSLPSLSILVFFFFDSY